MKATRTATLSMAEAMRYVLTLPVSTVIVGCDSIPQLEENVAASNVALAPELLERIDALRRRYWDPAV